MKKIFTILTAVLITVSVFAQTPEKMSYQAVIRNSSDALVTNTTVGMQISILQSSINGTVVYTETQTPTTNANGLVSIEIGGGAGFSTIDWANDIYFIKTETDPTGGTNYTITGTSQLLSVPYALHAKTADNITGGLSETDPLWSASPSFGITNTNITNWSTAYGWGNHATAGYLTSFTETDPIWTASPSFGITNTNITNWNSAYGWGNHATAGYLTSFTETDPSVPVGTTLGDMQYWNGTAWVTVASGKNGQILSLVGGIPTWIPLVGPTDVYNPSTGKVWMDRNLGATQAATSSTDAAAYGVLYQWGRGTDGHQIRTSGTTTTLSSTDNPGHANFILAPISPYDWRNPQNGNLWQGVSGTNNPCPSGYRLPTEAEWEAERLSWSSNNSEGAFGSPLKLPLAGLRDYSTGSLILIGSHGDFWSSTVDGNSSRQLYFNSSSASMASNNRALGFSVRCIKD